MKLKRFNKILPDWLVEEIMLADIINRIVIDYG